MGVAVGVAFLVTGCVFCVCRCCGKCGGGYSMKQSHDCTTCSCTCLLLFLTLGLLLVSYSSTPYYVPYMGLLLVSTPYYVPYYFSGYIYLYDYIQCGTSLIRTQRSGYYVYIYNMFTVTSIICSRIKFPSSEVFSFHGFTLVGFRWKGCSV